MVLIPEGFGQANFKFGGTSCPTGAEVTLGIDVTVTTDTPAEIAQFLYEQWVADIAAVQTTTTTLLSVLVKFGPAATGASAEFSGSSTGEIGSSGVAPQVSLLVQKITADGGRGGRGRLFMPGASEADVNTSGIVDGAYLAAAQGAFSDFRDAIEGADLGPVVLHGAESPLVTPSFITSFVASALVASQRRRVRR